MALQANIVVLLGNTEPAFISDKKRTQITAQEMAHTSKYSVRVYPLNVILKNITHCKISKPCPGLICMSF